MIAMTTSSSMSVKPPLRTPPGIKARPPESVPAARDVKLWFGFMEDQHSSTRLCGLCDERTVTPTLPFRNPFPPIFAWRYGDRL